MALGNFTDIILLLDRSQSMEKIEDAVLEGVNSFIRSQQEVPGEARLTLAQFSSAEDFRYTYQDLPLSKAVGLDSLSYRPTGPSTALYDAIARLIQDRGQAYSSVPEEARPEKVVFVIQTDGKENASVRYPKFGGGAQKIGAMIGHQRLVYKWQFLFIGADQDAVLAGAEFGVLKEQALTFGKDYTGTVQAFAASGDLLKQYRSAGVPMAYSEEHRKSAVEGNDSNYKPAKPKTPRV